LRLAAACARPFISQTILAKDDLPLAAFLTAAMVALSAERLRDPLGPWRLGAAVGLLLATKFTATFSLPAIALAMDAPWRAGWLSCRSAPQRPRSRPAPGASDPGRLLAAC